MNPTWGVYMTDYIIKIEGVCDKCNIPCQDRGDRYLFFGYTCAADFDIKYNYNCGRMQKAIELLRDLPSDLLEGYLLKECRTPTELKTVILDELKCRREYKKSQEIMRL